MGRLSSCFPIPNTMPKLLWVQSHLPASNSEKLSVLSPLLMAHTRFSDEALYHFGIWTIFAGNVFSCCSSACNTGIMYYFLRLNKTLDAKENIPSHMISIYVGVGVLMSLIFVLLFVGSLYTDVVVLFEYLGFGGTYTDPRTSTACILMRAVCYMIPMAFGIVFMLQARVYAIRELSNIGRLLGWLVVCWVVLQVPLSIAFIISAFKPNEYMWIVTVATSVLTQLQPIADCVIILKLALLDRIRRSQSHALHIQTTLVIVAGNEANTQPIVLEQKDQPPYGLSLR